MSDAIPKSRVTLTYDTKQPEGREKPRELPFRLLVLGDVGGTKKVFDAAKSEKERDTVPIDERKVRQLNGRNFGEVLRGFKVRIGAVPVTKTDASTRTVDVLVDSMSAFSPNEVLKLLTGQKAKAPGSIHDTLKQVWSAEIAATEVAIPDDLSPSEKKKKEDEKAAQFLWKGDAELSKLWETRELLTGFLSSYQNSKKLRDVLKAVGVALEDKGKLADGPLKTEIEKTEASWKKAITDSKAKTDAAANGGGGQ